MHRSNLKVRLEQQLSRIVTSKLGHSILDNDFTNQAADATMGIGGLLSFYVHDCSTHLCKPRKKRVRNVA